MKLLVFAGALRTDSANKKLAREAVALLAAANHEAEFLDLKDYPMPPYDGDIEVASGVPAATQALGKKIMAADALVIASPEYNAGMPGTLKNIIDWLSREKAMSLANKPLLLLAASPGAFGGIRVLWHSRQTYDALGMHVFPCTMGLSDAYNAFDTEGKLKDAKTRERLGTLLTQFTNHVKR